MTTNLQSSPYLPRQRNFPVDTTQALGIELDKSYIEIASRVNERIIGIYAVNFPIITGEQWYLSGQPNRQQSLRQFFTFSAGVTTITIPINSINFANIDRITKMYGTYTDATGKWYGLIAASAVPIAGQVSFYLTPNIGITPGTINIASGVGAPVYTQGNIVLEWLSLY